MGYDIGAGADGPILQLIAVVKRFGSVTAVNDVSLQVDRGELVTFLGPSGCGKTTLLRLIGGFSRPDGGQVWLGGRDVTYTPPYERSTCMVFQNYALFPHLDVFHNVAYGLRLRKIQRLEIARRVDEALGLVRLDGLEGRKPHELSGGQQQRVALARALVLEPDVLLLDEPLSSLDAGLRVQMREELRTLQQRLGLTVLFVTHDQEEAMAVSDRILVLRDGSIQQSGTPRELYEHPVNTFVAEFLGRVNLVPVRCESPGFVHCGAARLGVNGAPRKVGQSLFAVLRPESLRLSPPTEQSGSGVEGRIRAVGYFGATVRYTVETGLGPLHVESFAAQTDGRFSIGDPVQVMLPSEVHVVSGSGVAGGGEPGARVDI